MYPTQIINERDKEKEYLCKFFEHETYQTTNSAKDHIIIDKTNKSD